MTIFDFADKDAFGYVTSVDTATVVVEVANLEQLRTMQVNRLVALQSDPGQHLIGVIQRITRQSKELSGKIETGDASDPLVPENELNLVRVSLIGTLTDQEGIERNVFSRTLESVPRIHAPCFPIEEARLTEFMRILSRVSEVGTEEGLKLGSYSLDRSATAYLHGDKFFQRHAVLVGSTGSGKSYTTAQILEQVAELPNANAIVFDIHGEYGTLSGDNFSHYRIAGPGDLDSGRGLDEGVIHLPFWLLPYEGLIPMFVDRTDQNAPNQAMVMSENVRQFKNDFLTNADRSDLADRFTIDSPVPFDIHDLLRRLRELDVERETNPNTGKERNGPYVGKLTRLIARLESKVEDRRLGFLFAGDENTSSLSYLNSLADILIAGAAEQEEGRGGIKVLDFSEVPSDVLPLIVSLVARMAFSIQQWTLPGNRHPIALFCDEAHNYIPDRVNADSAADVSIKIFERIAKEGRKYGVGLVVISQRPAEVNRTVLSQCNNMVAMRLTNAEDQSRIKALLPDSLGGFGDLLPILDTGEAIVVGDASLLPSRIRVALPKNTPKSATVPFWQEWAKPEAAGGIQSAVESWRRQSIHE